MKFLQTRPFSEIKADRNWQSRGQHDCSYYQPKPATYKQSQQYYHDIITQKAPPRNDYDRAKVRKYGNINSGITTPDKKITFIPLGNNYYARKKDPPDSSATS